MSTDQSQTPTHLYRHFGGNGELLYVGISLSAVNRLRDHMKCSGWAEEISRVEIQTFKTRAEALKAERDAIKAECPKHNKHHKEKHKPTFVDEAHKEFINDPKTDLTSSFCHPGILFRYDRTPLPLSGRDVLREMNAGRLGYIELMPSRAKSPQRFVTGWHLIDYFQFLEAERLKKEKEHD